MMRFDPYTLESAPEASQEELAAAEKAHGAIPNLYRVMAGNPATLKIYLAFNELLERHGRLTPAERQVVYLAVSARNGCAYCVGAHSALAGMSGLPKQTVTELREQQGLSDPKLEAVRRLAMSIMDHRGWVPEEDLARFEAAGYGSAEVMEVVTLLAQKTLSNYVNHLADTPLDAMFQTQAWAPPATA